MALGLPLRPVRAAFLRTHRVRRYANVFPLTLVGKPPPPPPPKQPTPPPITALSELDSLVLAQLRSGPASGLPTLIDEYEKNEGHVLETFLPYESRPPKDRRVMFDRDRSYLDNGVVMVAHAFHHQDRHKVALCSGFVLNVSALQGEEAPFDGDQEDSVILTCAHTLEEMRNSSLLSQPSTAPDDSGPLSGSFVLSGVPELRTPVFHPVKSILSSLHRSDLLLLSVARNALTQRVMPSLPISPYPVHSGTAIRAHFIVDEEPDEPGWHPWVGGTWSKWVKGTVVGYRDFAGREAKPGTYDSLSHLMFEPLPTPGSSGGPIIDEETGAVVGVMVGTRMDSEINGVRGWGRPAETIFEMFSLPGLNLRKE
ncbi:hypothetical protein NM688_g8025 [Phlebia brevispora]|uniref:Uncharacterized protein n=1 Tax=Phlebia brevispora TaxID=194682 RepID=A0ACC1RYV3_9APHY|nr:hypothetical protein NM688_g8025 [Phlebia brevispora]